MAKKKIEDSDIEDRILDVMDYERTSTSISQVTKRLKEIFDIKISPQVVKRYLLKLKKEGKII
jgi:hypothetical protein